MKTGERQSATTEGGTQLQAQHPSLRAGYFSWTMKGSGPLMLGVPTVEAITNISLQ